jgi:transposase
MEIQEVVRRWQAGDGQRAIARASGVARETVKRYVRVAREVGLCAHGPPPTAAQLARLLQVGRPAPAARSGGVAARPAPQRARLEPYRAQIAAWLTEERLLLTRVQELLAARGVAVSYSTLERFAWRLGVRPGRGGRGRRRRGDTVRVAPSAPGEVAETDFGRLGWLPDPATGRRRVVWGLSVVLVYSRHSFLWPLRRQTVEEVIAGFEQAWGFFAGTPKRLVLDNFPAAIAGADPLAPKPTRAFLEYSQARGLLLDPARPRHPRDKPHVERGVPYARERFWKGGTFRDLADAQRQAVAWSRDVAGRRVHGTTRRVPLVVFEAEERPRLTPLAATPAGEAPYDVPVWRTVTVHADHHVSVQQALYSVPDATCPPGTKLEARCARGLVTLYRRGELVKVHPRQPKGGRATDPADLPPERAAYALRSPAGLLARAAELGPQVAAFAGRLLAVDVEPGAAPGAAGLGPGGGGAGTPAWLQLRRAQKLLRLGDRYPPARLDAACARALAYDLLDVRRLERILALALDQLDPEGPPASAAAPAPAPAGRFARPGAAFDHRFVAPAAPPGAPVSPLDMEVSS